MIQVFLGTKAQYVKTAPLLRLLDARGVPYRLIDSGQHAALSVGLRDELGVRAPDVVLGGDRDVTSIPQALRWAAGLATQLASRSRLRAGVFGGVGGVCVVHGDTPSTLLSTLMAKRAGLEVAHLEAGLRSHDLLDPFPEELIRVVVMRMSDVLFAPDAEAIANLRALRVRGEVVPLPANTVVESLAYALRDAPPAGSGPAIVTMHRVENLHRGARVEGLVDVVCEVAAREPVRWVTHGPTEEVLAKGGHEQRLRRSGVELVGLRPHGEFLAMLHAAPFVVTDGGSIQEECALLGVPTVLWRRRSERPDGIGRNVRVAAHDPEVIREVAADPDRWRHPRADQVTAPSEVILEHLLARG